MTERIFLLVLDSFGIGNAPDAHEFGDEGSNTFAAVSKSPYFKADNMKKLGLYNIDGVEYPEKESITAGAYGRLVEAGKGKDTIVGHWEMAGIVSNKAMPTFPNGFPESFINEFSQKTGRKILCNKAYSGTDVIRDYGEEQLENGGLIVYTSADSVFQVAANEDIIPLAELYRYCEIAREMLVGDLGVGRVIARPFTGKDKNSFKRTANRHDYSLAPPRDTILDALLEAGNEVISVGKIKDIFSMKGISRSFESKSNKEGMEITIDLTGRDFKGLCFVNLVEFDMLYGHRNDIDGYAKALSEFDIKLGELLPLLKENDMLIITADHGCDPSTPSTDHSRECVPLMVCGKKIKENINLGTMFSFSCIANTIAEYFNLPAEYPGESFLLKII